eukprot:11081047-Alexandrium_andersonii.AAC.1
MAAPTKRGYKDTGCYWLMEQVLWTQGHDFAPRNLVGSHASRHVRIRFCIRNVGPASLANAREQFHMK